MEQWKIDVLAALENINRKSNESPEEYGIEYIKVDKVKKEELVFSLVYYNGSGYLGLIFKVEKGFYNYVLKNRLTIPTIKFIEEYIIEILQDFQWITQNTYFNKLTKSFNKITVYPTNTPTSNQLDAMIALANYKYK